MLGVETNPAPEIDSLALGAINAADATAPGPAQPAPAVETPGDENLPVDGGDGPNTEFCRDLVSSALDWHADSVYKAFYNALAQKAGEAQAKRIAERAAMSPNIRAVVADHSARVLDKYGLAQYIKSEAVLAGALLMYLRELSLARTERDEILKPPAAKPQP